MPFLLLPPIVAFLMFGCVAFMVCAAVPRLRRFALGAALWLAAWGVMSPGAVLLNAFALGVLAESHAREAVPLNRMVLDHLKTVAIANGIVISIAATLLTLGHGFIVRRITLALFRLYVTAVAAGVCFLACLLTLLAVDLYHPSLPAFTGSLLLAGVGAFLIASLCYRLPGEFRAFRPGKLQPVSEMEYTTIAQAGKQ
jgi:hypothetical protein